MALGTRHGIAEPPPTLRGVDPADAHGLLDALLEARGEAAQTPLWLLLSAATLQAPAVGRVFGVAAVGGGCAVLGSGPLCSTSACDDSLSLQRMGKVGMHELAHAEGLEHCADPVCVMHPSRSIEDIDRKARGFCARCAKRHAHATLDAVRG
jgi:archaemetzincin